MVKKHHTVYTLSNFQASSFLKRSQGDLFFAFAGVSCQSHLWHKKKKKIKNKTDQKFFYLFRFSAHSQMRRQSLHTLRESIPFNWRQKYMIKLQHFWLENKKKTLLLVFMFCANKVFVRICLRVLGKFSCNLASSDNFAGILYSLACEMWPVWKVWMEATAQRIYT